MILVFSLVNSLESKFFIGYGCLWQTCCRNQFDDHGIEILVLIVGHERPVETDRHKDVLDASHGPVQSAGQAPQACNTTGKAHPQQQSQLSKLCQHKTFALIIMQSRKEGNDLFNDTCNTFYLWLHGMEYMAKDHYMVYSF